MAESKKDPSESILAPRLKIRVGDHFLIEDLIRQFKSLHYHAKKFVERPGDFSSRGHILDIYPIGYQTPVRINFDLDNVESVHDFSLSTGEVMTAFAQINILAVPEAFDRKAPSFHTESLGTHVNRFLDIKEDDFVVHLDYGIARFLGYKKLQVKGEWKKHYALEFAEGEILYTETGGPSLLERYIGIDGRKPKLNKLRGKEWTRAKEKTRLAVRSVARDLLQLQAKRNALLGFKHQKDSDWQTQFEEEFPYEETPDQLKAIEDIKRDMESQRPMDRLICGDVGYGKTEVAMRAVFKAVMSGKQAAFLVPTTILAEQHYSVLKERMKSFPFRVEALSRFKSAKQQKQLVAEVRAGQIDVVIGTHRLLSRDVAFKDLGLVVIDEEQRFGVRSKERLKQLRELVDVLTLTATPIPRTLYMSLIGARDMSVIATPPQGRLPVRTELLEFNPHVVREALQRELDRKGQIFFVHNRIQSIDKTYLLLKKLLPSARFAVAHGRLGPHELENIMERFFHHEIDCLISTNIIESGLDVPNANTIFVDRADHFGLADLYQLRGRVGRFSNRQAYAYFLLSPGFIMSGEAGKRIRAIERFTELGSGFKVAMEDLEIRGAGNILGEEQSGYIYRVGFDLYCRLLEKEIDIMKKEKP